MVALLVASSALGAGCSNKKPKRGGTVDGEAGAADEGGGGPSRPGGGESAVEGGTGQGGSVGGAVASGGQAQGGGAGAGMACSGVASACIDAQTLQYCSPTTGLLESRDCEQGVPEGLSSAGCGTSEDGREACLLDFSDPECWTGAQIFGVCAGATTEQQLSSIYLACFNELNGAHTMIPCFIPFRDEATLAVDCAAAEVACLPDIGAGGAGGAANGEGGASAASAGAGGGE